MQDGCCGPPTLCQTLPEGILQQPWHQGCAVPYLAEAARPRARRGCASRPGRLRCCQRGAPAGSGRSLPPSSAQGSCWGAGEAPPGCGEPHAAPEGAAGSEGLQPLSGLVDAAGAEGAAAAPAWAQALGWLRDDPMPWDGPMPQLTPALTWAALGLSWCPASSGVPAGRGGSVPRRGGCPWSCGTPHGCWGSYRTGPLPLVVSARLRKNAHEAKAPGRAPQTRSFSPRDGHLHAL